jgi:hypothetical protein
MSQEQRDNGGSNRAPIAYRAPDDWDPGSHWIRKPQYWALMLMPSVPLLIFLLPSSVFAGASGAEPWYTVITTPIWLFVPVYVWPATLVASTFGVFPITLGWSAFVLAYTLAIGYGLCAVLSRPG